MVGSPRKTTRLLVVDELSPGVSAGKILPARVDVVLRSWKLPLVGVCKALMVSGVLAREFYGVLVGCNWRLVEGLTPSAPIMRDPPKAGEMMN
jgi:hypothetical protein